MEKWQYYGLFLTKDSRIKLLDFLRSDKCSTQVTLAVHYMTHIGISDKAMAFKVSLQDSEFDMCSLTLLCANKIPHITICTFNGGKPVNSNNITKWYDLNEPISIETILKKV